MYRVVIHRVVYYVCSIQTERWANTLPARRASQPIVGVVLTETFGQVWPVTVEDADPACFLTRLAHSPRKFFLWRVNHDFVVGALFAFGDVETRAIDECPRATVGRMRAWVHLERHHTIGWSVVLAQVLIADDDRRPVSCLPEFLRLEFGIGLEPSLQHCPLVFDKFDVAELVAAPERERTNWLVNAFPLGLGGYKHASVRIALACVFDLRFVNAVNKSIGTASWHVAICSPCAVGIFSFAFVDDHDALRQVCRVAFVVLWSWISVKW